MTQNTGEKQRIDKWLFFARFVKTRSLAQKLVDTSHVRLNGEVCRSSSHMVKSGDRLDLKLDQRSRQIEILQLAERRGPATEAQALYIDHTPPPPPRDAMPQGLVPTHGGRPEKAQRRAFDRLRARIFDEN